MKEFFAIVYNLSKYFFGFVVVATKWNLLSLDWSLSCCVFSELERIIFEFMKNNSISFTRDFSNSSIHHVTNGFFKFLIFSHSYTIRKFVTSNEREFINEITKKKRKIPFQSENHFFRETVNLSINCFSSEIVLKNAMEV